MTESNRRKWLIDSPELAKQLLDEFSRIKLSRPELKEGSGVNIPYWVKVKLLRKVEGELL